MKTLLSKERNIYIAIFIFALIFFTVNVETGTQLFTYLINVSKGLWGEYPTSWKFVYGNFDNYMIFGSGLVTVFGPVSAMLAAYIYNHKTKTILKVEFYRRNSRIKTFMIHSLKISAKIALSIFLAFLVYFLFGAFICEVSTVEELIRPWRSLFTDWFGLSFYENHRYLYYFIEGVIKYFVMTFVFSFLFCSATLLFEKPSVAVLFVLCLIFGMFELSQIAAQSTIPLELIVVFSPFSFYSSSTYALYNTIYYLLSVIMPFIYGLIIVFCRGKYEI